MEKKITLKDLAVDHDYYTSESNYYSNEAAQHYTTWADFYEEFHDADVDMNLVFRWDIYQREVSKRYWMQIVIIAQRKGIYMPILIDYVDETDVPQIIEYLKPHIEKIKNIWKPFNF